MGTTLLCLTRGPLRAARRQLRACFRIPALHPQMLRCQGRSWQLSKDSKHWSRQKIRFLDVVWQTGWSLRGHWVWSVDSEHGSEVFTSSRSMCRLEPPRNIVMLPVVETNMHCSSDVQRDFAVLLCRPWLSTLWASKCVKGAGSKQMF